MDFIMTITGKVKYPITLDVGSWLFDERQIDLDTYFTNNSEESIEEKEEVVITENTWTLGLKEGALPPEQQQRRKKLSKRKMLTGTLGIKLEPFLKNAEPLDDATTLIIITDDEEISLPLEESNSLIMQFSNKGKPLQDGPVHILYADGSNRDQPIKHVKGFRVE